MFTVRAMYSRKFNGHSDFYRILLWLVIIYASICLCRASWIDRDVQIKWQKHSNCSNSEFTCASLSECVEGSKVCDGVRDCVDGSDETFQECLESTDMISPKSSKDSNAARVSRATTTNLCDVPSDPKLSIVVTDDSAKRVLNIQRGSKAPAASRIEVTCSDDYALADAGKKQEAFCHPKKGWFPSLSPCLKTCPTLKPENVDLTCYYNDRKIACNATELVSGTQVETRCKPFYTEASRINYRTLRCREDGKWDDELYKCIPACGRINELDTLIYGGSAISVEESPWNVAIYHLTDDPTLICGGTLISPRLVVSAANCFYDQHRKGPLNLTNYEVIVSKYKRDYEENDITQKKHKVSRIILHENFDPKNAGHYGFDISLLVLQEAVELSKFALPACIDWEAPAGFNPGDNAFAKIAGWGVINETNDGTASRTLLTANLPFVSHQKCLKKLKPLANDHFCAGSDSGPGARKGDGGAGLIFQDKSKNDLYFLRGIVSTGKKSELGTPLLIVACTDISLHLSWLDRERKALEEKSVV